jgi:hypothetical protein
MAVGFLIGASGAVMALLVAAAMNLFTYWNADRIVLSAPWRAGGGRALGPGVDGHRA